MGAIITKIGLEKIAKATANQPLRLEKFAVGDGNGTDINLNSDMKSLVNEKYRDLISDKYTNGNNTVFEGVIKATAKIDEGFYIRELGLFDEAGDLIVITDVPLQYRPATKVGNVITELLLNLTIQVQDSRVIEIKINEQVFATADSLKRLLNRVEVLESNSKKLIESFVGVEKWFNTDNKYKNWNLIPIGIKTYALMDESNILKIADYPLLFKNINGVDRGDGTFAMPKFQDGTIRHLPKGHHRGLGTYQTDAIAMHKHFVTSNQVYQTQDGLGSIAFNRYVSQGRLVNENFEYTLGLTSHGANYGVSSDPIALTDNGVISIGTEETRMKNTSGQWYVLAKIDI